MRRRPAALVAIGLLLMTGAAPAAAAPGPPDAPQWYFDAWQVASLWADGARGQGITIAEIDTGVSGNVPEIAANMLPGKDLGNGKLDGRTDHDVDPFGHGTAMASLMVARPGLLEITGLAPDAKVLPIAVPIHGTDDSAGAADDQLPQAIRWATDHGGKIISLSLGGHRDPSRDGVPCPRDEQDAVNYAITNGALVVAASGNLGDKGSPVEDPGVCLGVVSVGAVDRSNSVATFSSRHRYLTMSAPGVAIASLGRVPGTAFSGDGTSQATALTSASLALVWSKYPRLSGRQVLSRVLATLDRKSASRDPGYGYGIVNPNRAITATVAPSAPNPVFEALDPFLARQRPDAKTGLRVPAPVATGAPFGEVLIGDGPGTFSAPVIAGSSAGVAGGLAVIALAVSGLRARRRRAMLAATGPPQWGWPVPAWPPGPPPASEACGVHPVAAPAADVPASSGQDGSAW
ncbi:MAG: S8 family serine peptidase [Actinomycetota bacterium]